MYNNLLRKNYNLKLIIGWKDIIVKYRQASILTTLEFAEDVQNENFDLVKYIIDFIEKNGNIELSDEQKKDILPKTVEIFENLKKTLFKSFFLDKKGSSGSNAPFSSFLMLICDKFSCDPNHLLKNYTWEQISSEDGYTDWIIWNSNEQTKEGQEKNRRKAKFKNTFTNSVEEDLKIAQQAIKD